MTYEELLTIPESKEESEIEIWSRHLDEKVYHKDARPGFKMYQLILEGLRAQSERGMDAVVAVTGTRRGIGKTNFSIGSSLINSRHGINFGWEDICYGMEDMPDIVDKSSANRANSYVIDEADDVADSRDFASKINKSLMKFMMKVRKNNNIYFWNIPDFTDLDSKLRNRAIDYWIYVFEQVRNSERDNSYANAALFAKNMNPKQSDKWGISEDNKYVIMNHADIRKWLKRQRNFVGEFSFPILPKPIEDKYLIRSYSALRETGRRFKEEFGKKDNIKKEAVEEKPIPQ